MSDKGWRHLCHQFLANYRTVERNPQEKASTMEWLSSSNQIYLTKILIARSRSNVVQGYGAGSDPMVWIYLKVCGRYKDRIFINNCLCLYFRFWILLC